jgi:hypothetical protein
VEAKQTTCIAPEYHTLRVGEPRRLAGGLVEVRLIRVTEASGAARFEVRKAAPDAAAAELAAAAMALLDSIADLPRAYREDGNLGEYDAHKERLRTLALAAIRADFVGGEEGGRR